MIGAGAVQTIALARFANADPLLNLLSGGGAVSARVVADSGGLALALPNARLPLPAGLDLPPGMPVRVQIIEENGAKQIQIRPQTSPAAAASASPAVSSPSAILSELLPVLSSAISQQQALALTPNVAGLPREAVRALLEMLVGRERVAMQLGQLVESLDAAVTSGKLMAGVRDQFLAAMDRFAAETSAEFARALDAARASLRGRPSDARPAGERALLDDLLALRNEIAAHRASLGSSADPVLRAIDPLVERFEAARMQNVRGFEAPYQFLEVPFPRASGFERGQVHFFGDESRGSVLRDRVQTVVLDLELSRLGSLWIQLQTIGEACSCLIRASAEPARHAIDEAAPALEESLRAAGYGGARVRAEAWDGDRVTALAAMASRFSGFEANA